MKKNKSLYRNRKALAVFGITWLIIAMFLLAENKIMNSNGAYFPTLPALGVVFLPGALGIGYFMSSNESSQPSMTKVYLYTFMVIVASLVSYSWVYLAVNGL